MTHRILLALAALTGSLTASRAASAETITATLSFLDGDGLPAPIVVAKVEIWCRDGLLGGFQREVATDGAGRFSMVMPFVGRRTYALRVFATNQAAEVFQQDVFMQPFYREPGLRTSFSPTDVLDFSFTFTDDRARNHFNVADAILRGKTYADQRRDPRESDVIPRVAVLMSSASTFYDPILHLIRLQPAFALDDPTVLHEYAHFLEEQISSASSPGSAWMEGFASYFARAVGMQFGADVDGPGPFCAPTPSDLEVFVGGALLDAHGASNELGDEQCAAGTPGYDTIIFQIFDRELDTWWRSPTLAEFTDAWIGRGLDPPPYLSSIGPSGLRVTFPSSLVAAQSEQLCDRMPSTRER